MPKFKLFVDESGEAGIEKVRTHTSRGASPFMVLGGAIVLASQKQALLEKLEKIRSTIGKKELHCNELNHAKKVYYSRSIAQCRVRLFGVISRKSTLGGYKEDIQGNSKKYYNKCAQYLLERVGMFMSARGLRSNDLQIVFEEGNFDYEKLRNLIRKCQNDPKHENTKFLNYIDADNIAQSKRADEPLLKIADLTAHALYKCVDKNSMNFDIPEPQYISELQSRFYGNPENNTVVGSGIYCVHTLNQLNLDSDVKAVFEGLLSSSPA